MKGRLFRFWGFLSSGFITPSANCTPGFTFGFKALELGGGGVGKFAKGWKIYNVALELLHHLL
jgi:hypothetical protein